MIEIKYILTGILIFLHYCNAGTRNKEYDYSEPWFEETEGRIGTSSSDLPCTPISIGKKFTLSCVLLPDSTADNETPNCELLDTVPSGTVAKIACKPPYQSEFGRLSESKWICNDGRWAKDSIGNVRCRLRQSTVHNDDYDESNRNSEMSFGRRPPAPQIMKRFCPKIESVPKNVDMECFTSNQKVSCDNLLPVGSKVTHKCKPDFTSVPELDDSSTTNICNNDGTWSNGNDFPAEKFSCVSSCGTVSNDEKSYANIYEKVNNSPKRKQWPWHAALFLNKGADTWNFACGASLIHPSAVVTAAYCVTETRASATVRDPGEFRVEFRLNMMNRDDDLIEFIRVKSIIVHPKYNGSFHDNIAVLLLESAVKRNPLVKPICLPSSVEGGAGGHEPTPMDLEDSTIGKVVGWGTNPHGDLANELQVTPMEIIKSEQCFLIIEASPETKNTVYCTSELQFGSIYLYSGSADEGSGFFISVKESGVGVRSYLHGVLSSSQLFVVNCIGLNNEELEDEKCNGHKYYMFAKIGIYVDWIHSVISKWE